MFLSMLVSLAGGLGVAIATGSILLAIVAVFALGLFFIVLHGYEAGGDDGQ